MIPHPKAKNNITSLPKVDCYGCGACVNACPLQCIHMAVDYEGFPYPQVDHATCNECGVCIGVCPGFNTRQLEDNLEAPIFFGGNINNDPVRYLSSSGGMFSLFANHILSLNGAVYGAVYDFQRMKVVHTRAESLQDLTPMRKSKYVQSDTGFAYQAVKKDLQEKKHVLFTGTPCQVDGLCLFLGKDYDNLLTCDIICHGVPSPGLFTNHFAQIRNKHRQPITQIDFRTKQRGWGSFLNFYIKNEFESKESLRYALTDAYYTLFLANLTLRPCCYACRFASLDRKADLTMGDFWGVKKDHPRLFDGKGTSLLLVNTKKGQQAVNAVQDSATLIEVPPPEPLPPNLVKPTPKPSLRDAFFQHISLNNWGDFKLKYHLIGLFIIVKTKATNLLRNYRPGS